MLGHSDLSTTLRYVHAEELDGSAAYVLGTYLG
jgi:site-specific recombinase XerD